MAERPWAAHHFPSSADSVLLFSTTVWCCPFYPEFNLDQALWVQTEVGEILPSRKEGWSS